MSKSPIHVLIVDDDEDDFVLLQDTFKDIGDCDYSLSWAATAKEAAKRLISEKIDVCLSDYHIGSVSGLELIEDVRAKGCDCPIILVTGAAERDVDLAATDVGAADYLEKDQVSPDRLERSIRYSIAQVERQRLKQAKEGAEEVSRLKSAFLAMITHELRTPLNAIVGFSDIMLSQTFGEIGDGRYQDCLKEIKSSTTNLQDIIESILEFSQLASGRFETCNDVVIPCVEMTKCLSILEDSAAAKSIEVVLDIHDPTISLIGDTRSIQKIIINLLSNAIKFSPDGSKIIAALEQVSDGGLIIKISDPGIGMPHCTVAQVFEPFQQADDTYSRNFEGIGLGLSLVRALASLHDAEVSIDSNSDVGTMVAVRFPASRVVRDLPAISPNAESLAS